jgi:hypothetical protein
MTPSELVTFIRQRHNVVSDNFWSDTEILGYVHDACMQLARDALCIERVYTTTTVAGTQEYSYPSSTISIKRITWNGEKLQPISFREDDQLTGLNQATTSQGDPQYYAIWNETLYLRPIPSSAQTLTIFSYNEPQTLTITSTLEIPSIFHADTADLALSYMHAKEKNFQGAQYWRNEWDKKLLKAKQWSRKRLRGDSFSSVMDVDSMNESFLGTV